MKHSHRLALAAAFAGSAIAYGIHVFGKHDATQTAAADPAKLKSTSNERSRFPSKSAAGLEASNRQRPNLKNRKDTVAASAGAVAEFQPQKVGGSPQVSGGGVTSESEWHEQAARVEMEANHELSRLTTLLNLDATQQEKVFASLAQQSSYWQPGMQTGSNLGAGGIGRSTNQSSGSVAGNPQGQVSADRTTASNANGTKASATTGQPGAGSSTQNPGHTDGSLVSSGEASPGGQTSGGSHTGDPGGSNGPVASSGGTQEGGPVTGTTMTTPGGQSAGPTGPTGEAVSTTGSPADPGDSVASSGTPTQVSGQSSPSSTTPETTPTSPAGDPTDSSSPPDEAAAPEAVEDPITYLTPEQQDALIADAMDSEAWWAEILPQLLPPTVTTLPPETLDFEGGDVLLEE